MLISETGLFSQKVGRKLRRRGNHSGEEKMERKKRDERTRDKIRERSMG